jgi:hypothetical protein
MFPFCFHFKKNYVYIWADGIHCNAQMEDARLCLLVLIGVREDEVAA